MHILFGATSPIFLDADEIYHVCLDGHRDGYLDAICSHQADWFAHVLWALTCASCTYFQSALCLDQLAQGLQLQRPFRNILPTIRAFTFFTHPTTPDELKLKPIQQNNTQDNRH